MLQELPAGVGRIVWSKLSDSALASVSMGYQVGVTPLQMATAVSLDRQRRMLMRPHLVRAVIRDGVRHPVAPEVLRRTITADTAADAHHDHGRRRRARHGQARAIDGYTIARQDRHRREADQRRVLEAELFSSFIGFMPSRKPACAVLVMVDAPSVGAYSGGLVAAPIFKRDRRDRPSGTIGIPRIDQSRDARRDGPAIIIAEPGAHR